MKETPSWSYLGNDKCIVFLSSEQETKVVINLWYLQGEGRGGRLEFRRWWPGANFIEEAFQPAIHWIEVFGLPLHLRSLGFFKAIGGLCGGFVKVAGHH